MDHQLLVVAKAGLGGEGEKKTFYFYNCVDILATACSVSLDHSWGRLDTLTLAIWQ